MERWTDYCGGVERVEHSTIQPSSGAMQMRDRRRVPLSLAKHQQWLLSRPFRSAGQHLACSRIETPDSAAVWIL